ncbi:MAG: ankyrin repeat domain-containing protein [Gammaproteobacteria bacterium]|nr:ankyrin repeat domain-containing protein [Gammaproteobacteria bacterium]
MSEELLLAVQHNAPIHEIQALLRDPRIKVNFQDRDGTTALHEAALRRNIPIMELLLRHRAKINLKDRQKNTALHYVYLYYTGENEHDLIPAINTLLARGANPNQANDIGETIVKWAAFHGHIAIMRCLLDANADAKDAMIDARSGEHLAMIKLLSEHLQAGSLSSETDEKHSLHL